MKRIRRFSIALMTIAILLLPYANILAEVVDDTSNPKLSPFGIIDTSPPEMADLKLSVDEIEAPGVIEITLEGSDDISGLERAELNFRNKATNKDISVFLRDKIYNNGDYEALAEGVLKGTLEVDQYQYPGEYELEWIYLRDRAGNNQTYYKDIPDSQIRDGYNKLLVQKTITVINEDIKDKTPPEMTDLKLSVDEIEAPGVIEVTLRGTDDISGLERAELNFRNKATNKDISVFLRDKIYNNGDYEALAEGVLKGTLEVDQYQYPGEYELEWIYLRDRAGNNQTYYKDIPDSQIRDGYNKLLVQKTITVINKDIKDKIPPEMIDLKLSTKEVKVPGVIEVTLRGTDDISGLERAELNFRNKATNKDISVFLRDKIYNNGDYEALAEGVLKGTLEVDQYQYPGEYELEWIYLRDRAGNNQTYYKDIPDSEIRDGYKKLLVQKTITVINSGGGYKLTSNTGNPKLAEDIKSVESAPEGQPPVKIGINYETGSKVSKDVFEAVSGQNKELVFEGGSTQWVFNGKDIQKDKLKDIDLNVKINNLDRFYEGNADAIRDQVKNKPTYVMSFPNNGQLPGKATIRLKVDYEFMRHLGREDLSVYYFDKVNNKLVSVKKNVNVSSDGFVEFEIEHNSDFLIVNENASVKSNNAYLKSLKLDQGKLNPSFNKNTFFYRVNVGNSTEKIKIEALTEDSNAIIEGSGEKDLKVGYNNFSILVIAEDGKTRETYMIEINRESNNSSGGSSLSDIEDAGTSVESKEQAKTTLDIIKGLSKKDKEAIVKNLNENIPYTSIDEVLTEELVKKLTNNKFTKKELEEILKDKTMLKELGLDKLPLSVKAGLIPVENPSFSDIKEHWANDLIMEGAKKGFIVGMPDGSFKPNNPLQVADTFTFLDRVLLSKGINEMKLPRSVVEKYITDKEHWGFNSVASISSKLSEDTLKLLKDTGKKPITREVLAQVLFETTDGKLKETKIKKEFHDTKESPYKDSIDYCVRTGLLVGTSENTMSPEKILTRAELVTILTRLDSFIK